MSADNRVCIMQDRYGRWCVWEGSESAQYHEPPDDCCLLTSKKDAWDRAREIESRIELHGYLEYGVQEINLEEQRIALIGHITDLQDRLDRLTNTGSQYEPQIP